MANAIITDEEAETHFEYRVWGEFPKARRALAKLADSETREHIEDCYLLVDDMAYLPDACSRYFSKVTISHSNVCSLGATNDFLSSPRRS